MKSLFSRVAAAVLLAGLAAPAFADAQADGPATVQKDGHAALRALAVKRICKKVRATDEQKAQILSSALSYEETAIPLEAAIKVAKVHYLRNALSREGTLSLADSTAQDAITAGTSLAQAKESFASHVLFDVLTFEQRPQGLKCMVAIKELKDSRPSEMFD
jgi:hypothetical protein